MFGVLTPDRVFHENFMKKKGTLNEMTFLVNLDMGSITARRLVPPAKGIPSVSLDLSSYQVRLIRRNFLTRKDTKNVC